MALQGAKAGGNYDDVLLRFLTSLVFVVRVWGVGWWGVEVGFVPSLPG